MVGFPEVERIALRKRWMVTKCDLSRQSLAGSVQRLRSSVTWFQSAFNIVGASGRVMMLAAPLLRFLPKRRVASVERWSLWRTLWGTVRQKLTKPKRR